MIMNKKLKSIFSLELHQDIFDEMEKDIASDLISEIQKDIDNEILQMCKAEAVIGDDPIQAILYAKSDDKYMREKAIKVIKGNK
jgi:hypothetical protein